MTRQRGSTSTNTAGLLAIAALGIAITTQTCLALDSEGYGTLDEIHPNDRVRTEGSTGQMTLCRIKPWQGQQPAKAAYEAGRLDGNRCHYGWGGLDAWNDSEKPEVLKASSAYVWVPWNGDQPQKQNAVGTELGNAHCAVNQDFGGQAWWPGKIIYGEGNNRWQCNVPALGQEHVYWPGSGGAGTLMILVKQVS